jgi:hypothetical protein
MANHPAPPLAQVMTSSSPTQAPGCVREIRRRRLEQDWTLDNPYRSIVLFRESLSVLHDQPVQASLKDHTTI